MRGLEDTMSSVNKPMEAPTARGQGRWLPLLIVGAVFLAYRNSFHTPFVFDDFPAIVENPNLRVLWPITKALSAPPDAGVAGRPLVCLSLAINYAIGGLNTFGFHVFNFAVHVLTSLALYGVARRTLVKIPRFAARAAYLAAVITVLWAVHPIQTESVTYLTTRAESMMGLFLILTLYCVIRGGDSIGRLRVAWFAGAVSACAAGMACKEAMIVAPLIMLLYDRTFLGGSFREIWKSRRWLYVGLGCTALLLPVFLATVSLRDKAGLGETSLNSWQYLKTQATVIVHYLRLAVWPNALCVDYDDWPVNQTLVNVLPWATAIVMLLIATVWALMRWRPVGFLGAWFFLILAPTSSVLPLSTEVAAERRMYLPLAAVVSFIVLGANEVMTRVRISTRAKAIAGATASSAIAIIFIALTNIRNDDYDNPMRLWTDTLSERPNNARALGNFGNLLVDLGRNEEARLAFEHALRIKPRYQWALNSLGTVLVSQGKTLDAVNAFQRAIEVDPYYPLPYLNLGDLALKAGHHDAALTYYVRCTQMQPDDGRAYDKIGCVLATEGKMSQAIDCFERSLRLMRDDPEVSAHLIKARELNSAKGPAQPSAPNNRNQ
jgi:tetratricopeptide (TPR) repeat protein